MTPQGTSRPRPGGRTRRSTERIVAATMQVLREHGYAGVTFAEVATRAGVSRTTLYRRWSGPAALVTDAIRIAATASVPIPDSGDFATDLRQLLGALAGFLRSPAGSASVVAGAQIAPDARTAGWDQRYRDVHVLFQRAQDRGELPRDFDAPAAVSMLAGAVYFRMLVMGTAPDEEWADRVVAVFTRPTGA